MPRKEGSNKVNLRRCSYAQKNVEQKEVATVDTKDKSAPGKEEQVKSNSLMTKKPGSPTAR